MLTKLAAITILPTLLVGGVVMNSSIMLVQVNTEDVGFTIPVPLALAQMAVAFAPSEAKYVEVPEVGEYLPYLERIVAELREIDDVVLVEVVDGRDHVTVSKRGDILRVEVNEGSDEKVFVSVPLAAIAAIADAYDHDGQYFRTSRLVGALRAAPSGDLVHVLDGDEEVRIRMW